MARSAGATADREPEDSNSQPPSPRTTRRPPLMRRSHSSSEPDERSPLLTVSTRSRVRIHSGANSPRLPHLSRNQSYIGTAPGPRHHSRHGSWSSRLITALSERRGSTVDSKRSNFPDERVWYDQFTSTDWVHDTIADSHRVKALRSRQDLWGRIRVLFDGVQGWILSALSGFIVALIAYSVDVAEITVFDYKDGYCTRAWYLGEERCCPHGECQDWKTWAEVFHTHPFGKQGTNFSVYMLCVVGFSVFSCWLALWTKTVVPSAYRLTTLDENLAAEDLPKLDDVQTDECASPGQREDSKQQGAPMVYYSAAGSGVAEVRVILSGFVLHGFLGFKTLVIKMVSLIFSVSSGLSLGKEGPYVHMATCVGNIACRLFPKYDQNDAKRREALSAAAAAGVAVAFGAPLGGVLFGLEEVAYFFPAKTLFRTFFCCIIAALSLKFLNPYGTHKIVMFEVRYLVDWEFFELLGYMFVGVLGGAIGALFIKAHKLWAQSFRRIRLIKTYPMLEVFLVAVVTGLMSYWNVLTKLPVAKLLLNLASPCDDFSDGNRGELGLCPSSVDHIPPIISQLFIAFLIKGFLTVITFGIKVPSGIYIPSMVVGGLLGRIVGHLPGVYGLIAAGATMCGTTRLSVTLAVILFELTGSLDYVLPFSLSILVAKWTADAIEPRSIYDLLTSMNSYPFLDNKHKPVFTGDLEDIVPRLRRARVIDITNSPLVSASSLRAKLEALHRAGELDGGLPIVRHDVLVGLIPAPDLEYALDRLEDEQTSLCLMDRVPSIDEDDHEEPDPTDFTQYIDPAPVALDIRSPMDLVYECFVKLGLRYICVLKDGKYAGMTHKKTFAKYMRQLEEAEE
ncbi:voltage gated chloride channel domain-containing protein [Hirsutella rhossiliensis]|uniref:Voltage gated chloride channel domain-containing protein n=1 Tax=Hirsutella rhossiliensis TaxID=111463 RepID=A0A9P8MQC4_9HYPO|nr:voltage gated chloride channel domain-containing protein [Hirsutella rhossiliensis]KAH0959152.1 voltage gated chloride channel domain-containing protein [Hirsutella rhossiliensis]